MDYIQKNPPDDGLITNEYFNKMLEYYKKIQENLPDESYLFPISEKRPVPKGSYKERFVFSLVDQDISQLPNANFWLSFRNQMLGGGLKNFLISRFADILKNRVGSGLGSVL